MTNEQIIAQLLAIRATVDAILAVFTDEPPAENTETGGECDHPPDQRQFMDTMGYERWQCKICGYMYERKVN